MQNKIEETRERIRSEYDPGKACLIYVYANVGHQQYHETIRSLISSFWCCLAPKEWSERVQKFSIETFKEMIKSYEIRIARVLNSFSNRPFVLFICIEALFWLFDWLFISIVILYFWFY